MEVHDYYNKSYKCAEVINSPPLTAGKYFSDYYGFGVVNVARAVGMAKYWEPVAPEVSQSFVATPFAKFNDSFRTLPILST